MSVPFSATAVSTRHPTLSGMNHMSPASMSAGDRGLHPEVDPGSVGAPEALGDGQPGLLGHPGRREGAAHAGLDVA